MKPADRIRLRRNPPNVATPQGSDDLYFNEEGSLIHESPGGVKETVGGSTVTGISDVPGLDDVLDEKQTQLDDRLASYRMGAWRATLNNTTAPIVGIMGDSMLANAATQLDSIIRSRLGYSGTAFVNFSPGGGAATKEDPATWFLWNSVVLSASGHTAEISSLGGTGPIPADTIKVYYATKPGGGVFKIQTKIDSGSWTDEASYLTVSTDAAISGQVITITKTDWRKTFSVRMVWVSGNVDAIGGGLYLSTETGARVAYMSKGGYAGNMVDWVTQNTAIFNPILADIGLDLVILSHLDGEAAVTSYQATWQNMVNTASGTAPAWMCVGPPASSDSAQHALNAAQASAMRTLAVSRGDAFWDNKDWAGTSAQAIASGYCGVGDISHYTTLGINQWVTRMVNETAIFESQTRRAEEYWPSFGAKLRRYRNAAVSGTPAQNEHQGELRICNPDGVSSKAVLTMEPLSGATSVNDGVTFYCDSNSIGYFGYIGGSIWAFRKDVGPGTIFYAPGSTVSAPNGVLGIAASPIRSIIFGKTITAAATTGAQTINKTTGSVNFAAGATSLVVTNSLAVAPTSAQTGSIIMATVRTNDTTMKSVAVVCSSNGSFTLYPDAAPTAETRVDFAIITP